MIMFGSCCWNRQCSVSRGPEESNRGSLALFPTSGSHLPPPRERGLIESDRLSCNSLNFTHLHSFSGMFDCYLPQSRTAYRLNDTFCTYLKSEKVSVLGHEEVIPVLRYFKRDMRVNSDDKWFSVDCELNQSQSILHFSREEINNSA